MSGWATTCSETRSPAEYDEVTLNTKRSKVGFAAGVTLRWALPREEIAELDARDKLVDAVRDAARSAATALHCR